MIFFLLLLDSVDYLLDCDRFISQDLMNMMFASYIF